MAVLQLVLAALDLQAKAAHVSRPEVIVQLGRAAVPLPFVVDEAGEAAALECVEDAGLGPAFGVVPPVRRELFRVGLHCGPSLWVD